MMPVIKRVQRTVSADTVQRRNQARQRTTEKPLAVQAYNNYGKRWHPSMASYATTFEKWCQMLSKVGNKTIV